MAGGSQKKGMPWVWPISLMATAMAGLGVVLLRGCWHRKMSWPVRSTGVCYQVCTGCGIKRLFNERYFRAYGPYSYDLEKLRAYQRQEEILEPPFEDIHEHRSAS